MTISDIKNAQLVYFFEKDGAWGPYHDQDAFLKFISPYGEEHLSAEKHRVQTRSLPFYNDVNLLKISKVGEDDWGYAFFIENGYEYAQLKGMHEVIQEVNSSGVLNLNEDTVYDYVKFFWLFSDDSSGENARVIEGQNSEFVKNRSPYEQSRYLRKYSGATVEKNEKLGHFIVTSRIWQNNAIYDSEYEVTFDGRVHIKNSKLVGTV